MYQKIDDIDAHDTAAPQQTDDTRSATRAWLMVCVILGFSAMLAGTIWKLSLKPLELTHPAAQPSAIAAFNTVQSEPRASVRRARLIDFVQNHTDSPVINSARQQLRIMDEYEASDWAAVSNAMFSDALSPLEKRLSLDRYISQWGEGLVGSRDEKVKAYKSELGDLNESETIDRRQKTEASPISGTIDGTRMAGGQTIHTIVPSYPIATTTPLPAPAPIIPTAEITPLQIRKSKRPEYPRRAYSRGISAVVEVTYNVDEKGRVVLAKVTNVDAPRYGSDFKRAAKRAARKTSYFPRIEDGVAVPVTGITKTYVFDPSR